MVDEISNPVQRSRVYKSYQKKIYTKCSRGKRFAKRRRTPIEFREIFAQVSHARYERSIDEIMVTANTTTIRKDRKVLTKNPRVLGTFTRQVCINRRLKKLDVVQINKLADFLDCEEVESLKEGEHPSSKKSYSSSMSCCNSKNNVIIIEE